DAPGHCAFQTPDAAVIAIQQFAVRIKGKRMMVGMGPIAVRSSFEGKPGGATINTLHDLASAAGQIDRVRIRRIDSQREAVPGVPSKPGGRELDPGGPTVSALQLLERAPKGRPSLTGPADGGIQGLRISGRERYRNPAVGYPHGEVAGNGPCRSAVQGFVNAIGG